MSDPILYLRARNPVPASDLDHARFRAPMDRLESIMASAAPRPDARRWRRPVWTASLAAVIVVVVASVVLFTRGGTSEASAALDRLAVATERQRELVSSGRPVQTTITQLTPTTVGEHGGYVVLQPQRTAMVIRSDGTMTRTTTTGEIRFPGSRDRQRWILSGSPPFTPTGTSVETSRGEPLSSPPPSHLGTPEGAGRYLADTAREQDLSPVIGPFIVAQELLAVGPTNPDVQANVYRALRSVNGLSVSRADADGDGNPSVTISGVSDHTGARMRYEMTFDAVTGQLMSSSQVLLDAEPWIDAEPPFTLGRYTATPLNVR